MILAKAALFALMVTVGSQPSYEYDTFPSYSQCVEAAQGQNFDQDTRWECVAKEDDDE